MRSWSLLKDPPLRTGEKRLAVERENFRVEAIAGKHFEEEAFGHGRVYTWDEGFVTIKTLSPANLMLVFQGGKMLGTYQLRKMRWYPGNRWMITKLPEPAVPQGPAQIERDGR